MKKRDLKDYIRNLTLSAMFLALGIVLPFLTGQIPQIGSMLLPMHLPVFLCGLICGWTWGGIVGFTLPLFRSALFGMPPAFPTAAAMAFELATYGIIAGFLYGRSRWQCVIALYKAMLTAMLCGRLVWGIVMLVLTGVSSSGFTWSVFIASAFLNAIPGIILQLVFIPGMMLALDRTGLVRFKKRDVSAATQVF